MSVSDFSALKKVDFLTPQPVVQKQSTSEKPKLVSFANPPTKNLDTPSNAASTKEDLTKKQTRDKQSYLEEKAKHLEMPTAEEAELIPKYLFDDAVFIMHMCSSCRSLSRSLPAFNLDSEYQKIELKLCRICCRATYNCQRRIKFFKHDLLCVKRRSDNRLFN